MRKYFTTKITNLENDRVVMLQNTESIEITLSGMVLITCWIKDLYSGVFKEDKMLVDPSKNEILPKFYRFHELEE